MTKAQHSFSSNVSSDQQQKKKKKSLDVWFWELNSINDDINSSVIISAAAFTFKHTASHAAFNVPSHRSS